jgi:hypothetical protein
MVTVKLRRKERFFPPERFADCPENLKNLSATKEFVDNPVGMHVEVLDVVGGMYTLLDGMGYMGKVWASWIDASKEVQS